MNHLRRSLVAVISVSLVGLAVFGVIQRQAVWDWWRLRDYVPSARIVELADRTTMTDLGRKLFFVHRPELNDKYQFVQNCPTLEQTIVLGCYITHRAIYIYDVQDERLNGIEEVTAAHEMLHAAYDRLSEKRRMEIDSLTAAAFATLTDERVRATVVAYERRDPSIVPTELHSILATEVRQLPSELEQHYAKYFENRLAVVEFSEGYEAVFTAQQARIQALADEIYVMERRLRADRQEIELREASLNEQAAVLNHMRDSGQIEAYNVAVPGYNQQVNEYRNMVDSYNADVARLNALIEEHNQLALERKELYRAMDARY